MLKRSPRLRSHGSLITWGSVLNSSSIMSVPGCEGELRLVSMARSSACTSAAMSPEEKRSLVLAPRGMVEKGCSWASPLSQPGDAGAGGEGPCKPAIRGPPLGDEPMAGADEGSKVVSLGIVS